MAVLTDVQKRALWRRHCTEHNNSEAERSVAAIDCRGAAFVAHDLRDVPRELSINLNLQEVCNEER